MLARRPQGACQRIARARRTLEVARTQPNAFRLEKDPITTALDIERPTVCAVAARIGHDGIGRRLGVAPGAGLVERLACTGEPLLQPAERVVVGSDHCALGGERRRRAFQVRKLILQGPRTLLDARQLHPRLGELLGRPLADAIHLLATPSEAVSRQLQLFDQ